MAVRVTYRPRDTSELDGKHPKTKREYLLTGTRDHLEAMLGFAQGSPIEDQAIDPATGQVLRVFRSKINPRYLGGDVWEATIEYASSQDTIDLNFNLGVQSVKIFQALEDIASYNCERTVSGATASAATDADNQANAAETAANAITALALAATTAAADAVTAANVVGVDPAVGAEAVLAASYVNDVVTYGVQVQAAVNNTVTSTHTAAVAAAAGETAPATTAAAEAASYSALATTNKSLAFTASVAADNHAAAATAASGGGNAQTLAAAAAAEDAADASGALWAQLNTAATAAATAATAANTAATAARVDQVPGGNGVPDFHGAIGVNGDQVEGTEIETGKVEFSVTKKWRNAVLPASYLITLAAFTDRSAVNAGEFQLNWLGQVLIFDRGTLRFRTSPAKQTGEGEVEIVYSFHFSRPIVAADDFRVGNSPPITKEGHHFGWTRYAPTTSAGQTVLNPKSFHVQRVYPYFDFNLLGLN